MPTDLDPPPLRELVAHAWFTIGFAPRRSLVLVAVEGEGSPGFTARVDLPPAAHRDTVAGVMAAAAARAGVRAAVALVVVEPAEETDPADEPRPLRPRGRPLVRALRSRLRAVGIDLLDAVLVDRGRYLSFDCGDPRCCPPEGNPLGDLRTTATAAAMVVKGRTIAGGEADLVADVLPDPWPDAVTAAAGITATPGTGTGRRRADLARWQALLERRMSAGATGAGAANDAGAPEPAPEEVAWLVPALDDRRFRDAALVSLLPGGARVARSFVRGGRPMPESGPLLEPPPDDDRFEAARALLAAVARGAPQGRRTEVLALLAWMSWWQGSGARARLLAAEALRECPDHGLAGLVDTILLHGVPPTWIRGGRPRAARGGGAAAPTG